MRICFYANHGKTEFFRAVSRHLESRGYEFSWIVPGRRLSRWLAAQGVPSSSILDLTTLAPAWQHPESLEEHRSLLDRPLRGAMSVRHMIQADRFLRERPVDVALAYLAVCASEIRSFALDQGIDVVIGEQTYALELLTAEVLAERSIRFLAPATTRIPATRFALFPAPDQRRFASDETPSPNDVNAAERLLEGFIANPAKPFNYERNRRRPLPAADWLLSPFKQVRLHRADPHELNRPTLTWLLRNRTRQVAYGQLLRAFPFVSAGDLGDDPFVIHPLHRQPEAAVDVMGFRLSDQPATVEVLARELPPRWKLVVKEHSHGLGDRSPTVLRRLSRIPGVVLVDPWTDSVDLARRAALTVTTTGTLAFEAGLLGLPAVSLIPMYFGPLLVASGVGLHQGELQPVIQAVATGSAPAPGVQARVNFLATLFANSRPGLVGARADTVGVLEPDNVRAVADGLDELLAINPGVLGM